MPALKATPCIQIRCYMPLRFQKNAPTHRQQTKPQHGCFFGMGDFFEVSWDKLPRGHLGSDEVSWDGAQNGLKRTELSTLSKYVLEKAQSQERRRRMLLEQGEEIPTQNKCKCALIY
eukprot:5130493-Pleurochrysis_carterae.AAC.2